MMNLIKCKVVKRARYRSPYMVKYDEGHGFHNEENQFEVYKAMIGFFGEVFVNDLKID